MISRAVSVAVVTVCAFAVNAAAAAAQGKGSDPTKIGDNAKDIVSPNAKAFWWIFLVAGLLYMAGTRKGSRAGMMGFTLLASGVAIYNPAGVGSMMQGLANAIV